MNPVADGAPYTEDALSETYSEAARETWSMGDFPKMGAELAIAGERLSELIPVRAGDRVLDVGTAFGNAALAAARRGAIVTGIDLVPELLQHAGKRAKAEGFHIDFREGNVMALPFPDASFDVVLSTFGAIFAPDAYKTASEIARVCRLGGTIAMANWTPDSLLGKLFRLLARYSPPGSRVDAPLEWGDEATLRERLDPYVCDLRIERRSLPLPAHSPEQWAESMRKSFPPAVQAFAYSNTPDAQKMLLQEMAALMREHSSEDGAVLGISDYLEAAGTRV